MVEVKSVQDDAWLTAESQQVSRYWSRYRLVLVTNTRDFVLVGEDASGQPATLETFRLARDAADFARRLETPRAFARDSGAGLGEYLCRALSHRATLTEPKDVAWLLASYARDALARVEAAGDTPQLTALRAALEEALGVRFERERGGPFLPLHPGPDPLSTGCSRPGCCGPGTRPHCGADSTGTTRCGICAPPSWPALFSQLAQPGRLRPLGLVEVLDWTAAALSRVDRAANRSYTIRCVPALDRVECKYVPSLAL